MARPYGFAMMKIEEEVRAYILKNYLFSTDPSALNDSVSLIKTGVIDSTGVLELMFFLEEKYGIAIADEEMIPENLDSVRNIAAFVTRKRA